MPTITTVEAFVAATRDQPAAAIYELFEYGTAPACRAAIFDLAPPAALEPFRAACRILGARHCSLTLLAY